MVADKQKCDHVGRNNLNNSEFNVRIATRGRISTSNSSVEEILNYLDCCPFIVSQFLAKRLRYLLLGLRSAAEYNKNYE